MLNFNLKKIVKKSALFVASISLVLSAFFYSKQAKSDLTAKHDPVVIIPLYFDELRLPYFYAQIQGKDYLFNLRLLNSEIMMGKNELDSLNKENWGKSNSLGFNGIESVHQMYLIPKLNIQELEWNNVRINEDSLDEYASTRLIIGQEGGDPSEYKIAGCIGSHMLKKTNLLLDIAHKKIVASKDPSELAKLGYNIEEWLKVPFTVKLGGLIIDVDTGLGLKKLFLTTSNLTNWIRLLESDREKWEVNKYDELFVKSGKLVIENYDFGSWAFRELNIPKEFDDVVDGVLGMCFIEDHLIYIDYPNKCLYLDPQIQNISE